MTGGHKVDSGKINAAGSAYGAEGGDLVTAAAKIETAVSVGQVGRAWFGVASTYGDAVKKYRDTVTTLGQKTADLGGKLTTAAGRYEKGEQVSSDAITKVG
jgi:uncharacterized protein YukE